MAKRGKRTTTETPQRDVAGAKIVSEEGKLPARATAADYARRRAEVDAADYTDFQNYLASKKEAAARKQLATATQTPAPRLQPAYHVQRRGRHRRRGRSGRAGL